MRVDRESGSGLGFKIWKERSSLARNSLGFKMFQSALNALGSFLSSDSEVFC